MKLTREQKNLLELIERSKDIGGGWKQVNDTLWAGLVLKIDLGELAELDHENKRIRLTREGKFLLVWL